MTTRPVQFKGGQFEIRSHACPWNDVLSDTLLHPKTDNDAKPASKGVMDWTPLPFLILLLSA